MSLTNTTDRYGGVTKLFHWLTALLILTALPLGYFAQQAPFADGEQLAQKAWLFSLHKTVGLSAFFVAALRILWALSQERPGLLNAENKLEATAAETVHWLLYGSMLLVPLTGWIHHASTEGFAPIFWPFGQSLPFVPKSEAVAEVTAGLHFLLMLVLVGSILAHVGGAMKHFVVDRDQTLQRMLPGANSAPTPPAGSHGKGPAVLAVLIWAMALGAGTGLGVFQKHEAAPERAALAQVQSDWQVQEGTLSITVKQFGADVTGQFADWTAAIRFDERASEGKHGDVAVTVAIGSLTLGSVTDQALGFDFFDAEAFPTATFTADILPAAEGYLADGTLALKGREMPVALPFDLELEEGSARMRGTVTLDRRSFGIGDNMPDESSLGFAVVVEVALTATRGAAE